jgi:hypothetical protein
MNGIELFERIQQVSTLDELLQSVNGKTKAEIQSKRGNMIEKVWDIIIKFGFNSILSNDMYDHYEGNINTCKVKKVDNLELYLKNMSIFSKGSGGSSDITLQHKTNGKWVFMSSKFYLDDSQKSIDKYDVEKIVAIVKQHSHKYHDFVIYLLVNNKQKVHNIISNSQSTNNYIKENIHHVMDTGDLESGFLRLKNAIQNITIDQVNLKFCNTKIPLLLRFHQELITYQQMNRINAGEKEMLLGAKARSGKTYCVGGLFIKYHKQYGSLNAMIITPAPTETLSQFTNDLFHKFHDFQDINIIEIKKGSDFESMVLRENNIVIVSKQLLDDYVLDKTIKPIQQLMLDMIVFDENHFHGTTDMSKHMIQSYSSPKTVKLYLTATYAKSLNSWAIPPENQFYWDIEDEQMCKKRDIRGLIEKHGEDVCLFLTEENKQTVLCLYDNMPDLHILTNMMESGRYEIIKEQIKDTTYGFSMSTLFSGEFPNEVDMVLRHITGSNKEQDYTNGDKSFFGRIKQLSISSSSRTKLNNGDFTSQLWFLPFGIGMTIDKVSEHVKERMLQNRILKNYEIKIVNSKKEYKQKDLKEEIKNWELKAKKDGKNGLILLAGNQLTLGITLPLVDVVFLMNDIISSDKIIQMMYRCMTESIHNDEYDQINSGNKKMGFVVDLNISRVLNTMLEYNVHKQDLNTEQKIKYLVENNLINIDGDYFQTKENKTLLVEKLLTIWKTNPVNHLRLLLKKLEDIVIELDTDDQRKINQYFTSSLGDKPVNITVHFDENSEEALPTGKEVIAQEIDNTGSETEPQHIVNISITKDVLPFILPLICILTLNTVQNDILEMLNIIKNSPTLFEVFQDQSFVWWNQRDIIKLIEMILGKYIRKNTTIYHMAIQIKHDLHSLIEKPKELLEFIDSCLKPKELEKKKFGEVFTPIKFVNTMLVDLEKHYHEIYHTNIYENESLTWADTTAGMGNFPIAIYYKLMEGLKIKIPDESKRKKHILEKMLFMAEYNKKNCFIIKQILNINNDYKLNLYEGNSLQLDIKKEFGIGMFDIVIGNPPYSEELKSSGATALYNKFVEFYIEKCKLLCFVIPSRWFSGGKGLDGFRKNMLERTDIVYIKHFDDASKIFGSYVDIKGGVNYFLKDTNYNGDCKYNGTITKLNKYDVFVDGKYHSIIDKVVKFETITSLYLGRYFGVESNDKRLKCDKTLGTINCYVSQQKGFKKYIEKTEIKKEYNFWKVITARAAHQHKSGFGNIFIGKTDEIHTGSYISFKVSNEDEALSLVSYLKCRLPNFMLSLRKNSQDIQEQSIKWIPLPPLNKEWTDKEVYKHFNLSAEDIHLIHETNIVGYHNIVTPNITVENKVNNGQGAESLLIINFVDGSIPSEKLSEKINIKVKKFRIVNKL